MAKKEAMPIATIEDREGLKTTIRLNTITDRLTHCSAKL